MAPRSPLHETYERVGAPRGATVLTARTARAPQDDPGWVALDALLEDDARFDEAVDELAVTWRTDRRDIAGGGLLLDVGFAVLLRAAAAFVAERRAPDLTSGEVVLRLAEGGGWVEEVAVGPAFLCLAADPDAASSHATVHEDDEALLRALLVAFDGLEERMVERVATRCRRPRRALWRHGGDTVAEAFFWAGEVLGARREAWRWGSRACELAPERLQAPCGYRTWRHGEAEQLGRVRSQCCLNYRTDTAAYCFGCPLKDDEHRFALLAQQPAAG